MISDVARWLGSLSGDQREFLTCNEHGGEIAWTEASPQGCPTCGEGLYVHVPHADQFELAYLVWKGNQRGLPQRYYIFDGVDSYRIWRWLGRDWLRRPWQGLGAGIVDEYREDLAKLS